MLIKKVLPPNIGPSTSMVQAMRSFDQKKIPLDTLENHLNWDPESFKSTLNALKEYKALDHDGEFVWLIDKKESEG